MGNDHVVDQYLKFVVIFRSVYLDEHAVILENQPAPITQAEEHTEAESTDRTLKGKTTFKEVLDWGVSQEAIESILDGPIPNPLTKVKDYCTEQGLDFEVVRPAIQAEIDKVTP